jgi:hypothetical protein
MLEALKPETPKHENLPFFKASIFEFPTLNC